MTRHSQRLAALGVLASLAFFACGNDDPEVTADTGVEDTAPDIATLDTNADVPQIEDTVPRADADDAGDTDDTDDTDDTADEPDAPECEFDFQCGELVSTCDLLLQRVENHACMDGQCVQAIEEIPCVARDPFCRGNEAVVETAICDGTACGVEEEVTVCSDDMVCGDGVCRPAPGYPSDASFRAVYPGAAEADAIVEAGVPRVAVNIDWATWQPSEAAPPCPGGWTEFDGACFVVDTPTEVSLQTYYDAGLSVLAAISGAPEWSRAGRTGCPAWGPPESEGGCAPDDPSDFARFAGFLAHRYRGEFADGAAQIDDFIIWPNATSDDWFSLGSWPNTTNHAGRRDAYRSLYWLASDAIRARRPTARVWAGLGYWFGGDDDVNAASFAWIDAIGATAEGRAWGASVRLRQVAAGSPDFAWDDAPYMTMGNVHELVGHLWGAWPEQSPPVLIDASGFTSIGADGENVQADAVCAAYRQALSTPGIEGFVYHSFSDDPDAHDGSLLQALHDQFGAPKAAATAWLGMEGTEELDATCGFELGAFVQMQVYDGVAGDVWATTRDPRDSDYTQNDLSWRIYRRYQPDARLLFDCRAGGGTDRFVSADPDCEGQERIGPLGWAPTADPGGGHPIVRCLRAGDSTHFVSDDPDCEGESTESVLGYGFR